MKKIPILLVEDRESAYRSLELIVDHIADVDWVDHLEEAKEKCLSDYSCIILDLGLPEPAMGLFALNYFKKQYPDIPVIVVSGNTDLRLISNSMKLGVVDFLQKPVDGNRLCNILNQIDNRKMNDEVKSENTLY